VRPILKLPSIFCYEFKFDFTHNRIESIQFKEENMKAKIFVVLFAVLFVAGSISIAGEQKPFKGWVQAVGDPDYNVNFGVYPYLQSVIDQRGYPTPFSTPFGVAQIQFYQGVNNVGGASIHENAQLYYYSSDFTSIDLYEYSVITVANGDQIFLEIAATFNFITEELTATETVVGGTGRFDGAEGSLVIRQGIGKDGQAITIYDGGYITTVGAAKKY
jgi:hypothetical protein